MPTQEELLDETIGLLGLSVRTANALEGAGVLTIRQLLNSCPRTSEQHEMGCSGACSRPGFKPFRHLLDIPNFGEKTLTEVFAALEQLGFVRKGHEREVEAARRESDRAGLIRQRTRRLPRI